MTRTNPLRNICIVGNISSGKSTLSQLLAQAIPNSVAIPENFDDNPFLKLYVADPLRWAFTNAVRYYYDYVRVYDEMTRGRAYAHCFIDAGGATNRFVYGEYLVRENIMTPQENELYKLLCDLIARAHAYPEPEAYIFLEASPEFCFARMLARDWDYQRDYIPLAYLQQIDKYHRAFREKIRAQGFPTLELNSEELNWLLAADRAKTLDRVHAFLGDA